MDKAIEDIVPIEPIEYQRARVEKKFYPLNYTIHNPRIIRYRDFSFNINLTETILTKIVTKTNMSKNVKVNCFKDRYLFYRYSDKPAIILDLVERKVCTSKKMIKEYGESVCQQQASILMRLLKQHGHASFRRVTVTANPDRIGSTKEDREITFKALQKLMEDYDYQKDIDKKVIKLLKDQ
jgi:hypothetical protein